MGGCTCPGARLLYLLDPGTRYLPVAPDGLGTYAMREHLVPMYTCTCLMPVAPMPSRIAGAIPAIAMPLVWDLVVSSQATDLSRRRT